MITIRYSADRGWHEATVEPLAPIPLHPATAALHYAQEIFEGLKDYRRNDDTIVLLRPDDNADRFNRSAARMAIPELPEETFVQALETLVDVDSEWVPSGAGQALYLRPFAFATDVKLGAGKPSDCRAGLTRHRVFRSAVRPISVGLSEKYVRAAPGGTGFAKAGANYAGALLGSAEAAEHGCDQVIWLDAAERRCVEEVGAMNLCFVTVPGPKPG